MKIFGKTLSEYIHFQWIMLALILIVGILRLGLSLAGVPNHSVKWLSVTILGLLGIFYYAIRVHTRNFGSYRHLLPLIVIQNVVLQGIIIAGIVWGITTGQDNIYTAPEYTVNPSTGQSGVEGKTWGHVGGHAVFGLLLGSILAWGIASLVLLVVRKVAPRKGASGAVTTA